MFHVRKSGGKVFWPVTRFREPSSARAAIQSPLQTSAQAHLCLFKIVKANLRFMLQLC